MSKLGFKKETIPDDLLSTAVVGGDIVITNPQPEPGPKILSPSNDYGGVGVKISW
jgi:hypothetical protein